jgi:hypothetical protein
VARRAETVIIAPDDSCSSLATSAGLTAADDPTDYLLGPHSMKFVTDGTAAPRFATKALAAPIDLSDKALVLAVKVDDFAPYADFRILLSGDDFASGNFDSCQPVSTRASQRWVEAGRWEVITIGRGRVTSCLGAGQWRSHGTGLADWTRVNAIGFAFIDTGSPLTVRINRLSYFTRPRKGILTLVFDDTRNTHFTVAKPYLDRYGLPGTAAAIVESITSGSSAYMTAANLTHLQDRSGWDVIGHAFSNAAGVRAHTLGYDSLTAEDGLKDFLRLRHYLGTHGFKGLDYLALPHGTWSVNAHGTANANPDVLGMFGHYLSACRTTYSQTWETYPPANRMKLRAYSISTVDGDSAASLLDVIDEIVVAHKGWLILNVHNLVSDATRSSEFLSGHFRSLVDGVAGRVAAGSLDYKTLIAAVAGNSETISTD